MLTAADLLAGADAIRDVEVPADLLGGLAALPDDRRVRLKPLTVNDLRLVARAARDNDELTAALMVQRSLVEPALAVRDVSRMPVGLLQFLLREVNAVIGGEGSNGGIIFPPAQLCRDSYTGMAFLLDRIAATECSVSQLAAQLPRYSRRLGEIPFEHGRLGTLMRAVEDAFQGGAVDRTDGLKIAMAAGWVHVRASNTEPILRLDAS